MNEPTFHIALFEPEIPPNTGNIIRLCANTGAALHLIHPLGFQVDEKSLRRAGLDYHQHVTITEHKNFDAFFETMKDKRIFAIETCGEKFYHEAKFQLGDVLLYGPETRGLPQAVIQKLHHAQILKIPMMENIRSLNLSNSVALTLYEAWRQVGFITNITDGELTA